MNIEKARAEGETQGTRPSAEDFTSQWVFYHMLRLWTPAQMREFHEMLSRRPECTPGEPKTGDPARDAVDWWNPGHRLTEAEMDAAMDAYAQFYGQTTRNLPIRRKAIEAAIRAFLALQVAPAPTGAREVDPETLTAIAIALRDIAKRENPGRGLWEHMGAHSQEHWRGEALKILSLIPGGAPRGTGEAG